MKLLFDENLSPRLPNLIASAFPGSVHVRDVGLRGAADGRIWDHALVHGFAIVSKDNDFRQRSFLEGPPPKIVWLDVGNAGTTRIVGLIRSSRDVLDVFSAEAERSLLVLSLGAPGSALV